MLVGDIEFVKSVNYTVAPSLERRKRPVQRVRNYFWRLLERRSGRYQVPAYWDKRETWRNLSWRWERASCPVSIFCMSKLFRDARLKVQRANKHIADLEAAISALKENDTATVVSNRIYAICFVT
jgi:hypothetical protein